jgi:bacterial/archaeal transporter family-2 protein
MVGTVGRNHRRVAVVAGLLFIGTVGAGTYAALTVTANLITSILIDHFNG